MSLFLNGAVMRSVGGDRQRKQRSIVDITGGSVTGIITTAQAETQVIATSDTDSRSNIFDAAGTEKVTINLPTNFNSGAGGSGTANLTLIDIGNFSNVSLGNSKWPTGVGTGTIPTGFTYSTNGVTASITNNTGEAINWSNGVGVSYNYTVTSSSAQHIIKFQFPPSTSTSHSSTGTGTFSGSVNMSGVARDWEDGTTMVVEMSTNSSGSYSGRINNITIEFTSEKSVFFDFDIDVGDSQFSGNVSNYLGDNQDVSSSLSSISSSIISKFPTVSVGSEFDNTIISSDFAVFSARDSSGSIFAGGWGIRDNFFSSDNVNYSDWNGWLNNYLYFDATTTDQNNFSDFFDEASQTTNTVITLTTNNGATMSFTTDHKDISRFDSFAKVTSITSQSGTPSTSGSMRISVSEEKFYKAVTIDTNNRTNISQNITFTKNSGLIGTPVLQADDGDNSLNKVKSSYIISDPSGSEVTSFTSSVASSSESDAQAIRDAIKSAIDNNVQTPRNYTSGFANDSLVISATTTGPVSGLWSVSVNHFGGNGTVSYGTAQISFLGRDFSQETATFTLSGGGLTSNVTLSGTRITSSQINTALDTTVSEDSAVTIADETEGRVLTSVENQQYPEITRTISNGISSLTGDILTLQYGDSL